MIKKIFLLIVSLLLSFIIAFSFVINFKNKNKDKLKKYSISETKHFISNLVKEIVDSENIYSNNIFKISRNGNNEIEIIDFDTIEVNKVLEKGTNDAKKKAEKTLNDIKKAMKIDY